MTADPMQRRLRDALYSEAMLLADDARCYFDEVGRGDGAGLDAFARVMVSCESLKVTTRLLHVVAWLLTRRAVDAGEMAPDQARLPGHRLGESPHTERDVLDASPARARTLIETSIDLHRRVARLDRAMDEAGGSPARGMQERLARAF